jgi:hypothetical protein
MNIRILGLAIGFTAASLFGLNFALAQAPAAEPGSSEKASNDDASKGDHFAKHKEPGKHEKAHHDKKEGGEAGEAKEAK